MKIGDNVIMVDGKGGVIISINDYIEIKRKSLREKVMENIKFRTLTGSVCRLKKSSLTGKMKYILIGIITIKGEINGSIKEV